MARPRKHDGVVFRRKGTQFWWIRYRDHTGTRREEPTGTADWKEAQKKLRERLQARDDNVLEIVRKGEELTIQAVGGIVPGELLEAASAHAEDARSEHACHHAPAQGVRRSQTGGPVERRDRRLPALSAASACEAEDQGGNRRKGSAQTLHGSPGIARASAHPERRRSQEAVTGKPMLGCRVSSGGEGAVPTALRFMVGAAADRGGRPRAICATSSASSPRADSGSIRS